MHAPTTVLDKRLDRLDALESRGVKIRERKPSKEEQEEAEAAETEEYLEEDGDYTIDHYDEDMDMLDDAGDGEGDYT